MEFKILTWNVLHPDYISVHGTDGKEEWLDYEYRLNLIKSQLRTRNADIICLQEVEAASIEKDYIEFSDVYEIRWQNDKRRQKNLYKWNAGGRIQSEKPHTLVCMTMVKKSIGRISSVSIGSRTIVVNVIFKSGALLSIANVHLETGKNTTDIHIKHLSKLIGESKEMRGADIICGDFNDFPGEPAMKMLEPKYKTVYANKNPKATFRHKEKIWIIDHIYYRSHKDFKLTNVNFLDLYDIPNKNWPSDHMWVESEFKLEFEPYPV